MLRLPDRARVCVRRVDLILPTREKLSVAADLEETVMEYEWMQVLAMRLSCL